MLASIRLPLSPSLFLAGMLATVGPAAASVQPGGLAPLPVSVPGAFLTDPLIPAPAEPSTESPAVRPARPPAGPTPEVFHDLAALPEQVRLMHDRMIDAAHSGDIERLRPLLAMGNRSTRFSPEGRDEDPISYLKSLAGDPKGRETLAIMIDLLETGYVHLNAGKPDEVYVWPYFYAVSLDHLTPPQIVDLLRIVTASDYEDMKKAGGYIFYSIGIAPDGSWRFFSAGE